MFYSSPHASGWCQMLSHVARRALTKGQIASFLASALSFVRVVDIRLAVFCISCKPLKKDLNKNVTSAMKDKGQI